MIGMGGRFPGAAGLRDYWRNLRDGIDSVGAMPADRLRAPSPDRGGFLEGLDRFDASFFSISPKEAASIDPQQRIALEVAWQALEHAGIPPSTLAGTRTGVIIGASTMDHFARIAAEPERIDAVSATIGSVLSAIAGRISFSLGLKGPSFVADAACASSLLGVHLACQSLRARETDVMLAGGVNVILQPATTRGFGKAGMISAAGRCRSFDAAADGFVRSEGCGILVLKRLADAERDGDRILALVAGTAVNQNGVSGALTMPNGHAQEDVIRRALENGGIDPLDVSYIEAHGSGTPLGDAMEATALIRAFGPARPASRPLRLGSVKTNIGHAEAAAGVAGLIKVILALAHRQIPAHLHFTRLHPEVNVGTFPLVISPATAEWPAADGNPRVAGVSAFSFQGTNAHVVLREAPPLPARTHEPDEGPHLLALSARSPAALRELARRLAAHLEAGGDRLGDVCLTAGAGRQHFAHRAAVVVPDAAVAAAALRELAATGAGPSVTTAEVKRARRPAGEAPATPDGASRTERVAHAAGQFLAGGTVDWARLYPAPRFRKIDIPGTPFRDPRDGDDHERV